MALIDDKQEILQVSLFYVSFCLYLIHTTHTQGTEDMTEQEKTIYVYIYTHTHADAAGGAGG